MLSGAWSLDSQCFGTLNTATGLAGGLGLFFGLCIFLGLTVIGVKRGEIDVRGEIDGGSPTLTLTQH